MDARRFGAGGKLLHANLALNLVSIATASARLNVAKTAKSRQAMRRLPMNIPSARHTLHNQCSPASKEVAFQQAYAAARA